MEPIEESVENMSPKKIPRDSDAPKPRATVAFNKDVMDRDLKQPKEMKFMALQSEIQSESFLSNTHSMKMKQMRQSILWNKKKKAPVMPENPAGMKGLAALLRYATELKAYKIEMGIIEEEPTAPRLTGMFGRLQQNFQSKMEEI